MVTYETDGFQVYEDMDWFYPLRYDAEYEDFIPFLDKDGFEVRFSQEAMAIDFLMSK